MTVWPGKEMAAWKEPLMWIGAGLASFLLCLALTFPYGALQTRIIGEVQWVTGMEVRATDWMVGFPPALEWRQITFSKSDWILVQLGVMRAQVGLLKALTGGVALDLAAQVDEQSSLQGTAKSTFTASSWSLTGPLVLTGKIQQVDLSKLVRRYVSRGILTGEFTHRLDGLNKTASISFGEGSWKAEARDVSLDQIPVGNGRTISLAFSTVSVGLACREQVCNVTEFKGDGIDGSFSGEGKITLQQPVQQSQLALSLTVIPGAGFASKASGLGIPPLPPGTPFTFKVVGTLAQARVAL